ncbi:MAG: DNA repair protein RadC [Candidatus Pacebacteria bacterium]|nr:DNA repair protein RadC [Candidatus Paceibacterota bacterium]
MTFAQTYQIRNAVSIVSENKETEQYILNIRDLPQEEKPREKLAQYGPEYLTTQELLAVVLGAGTKKEEVFHMSGRILKEYGTKTIASHTDPKKLSEDLDIPLVKSCQIIACFELGKRFFSSKRGDLKIVRTPKQVYDHVSDMHDLPKEQLRGLYLDSHYRVIHEEVISIGSVDANIIHPREVFSPAIQRNASAVVLVHNHPSGIVTPSKADIEITKQLVEAGKVLGVTLLDHIVVTKDRFQSICVDYT